MSRLVRLGCSGLVVVLIAISPPAGAQGVAPEQEGRRLRHGGQTADSVREAREEARALFRLGDEEVSYADVLADPDDLATSFRWAQQQVQSGELRGAAATLERILLLRPELASVRLLYAVVLYRLDSLVEAGRELDALAAAPLSGAERAEVDRYRKAVRNASRRTHVDASLTFGTQYDTNRNSAPSSGTRLVQLGDARFELDVLPDSSEQDDVGFFGLTRVGFEHDLGLHEGHVLLGSFSTYLAQQLDLGDFNTRAYAVELGGRYRGRHVDLTPMLFGGAVELSSETLLKNVGLDLMLERDPTPRRGYRGGLRVEWQDFDPLRQSVTANEHTGVRGEALLGMTLRPTPLHQLDADFLYRVKDARGSATPRTNDVFSHDGPELRLRHTWLLGAGRFLLSELSAGRDSYWRADRRITTVRRRRDVRMRGNVIVGLPLDSLLPESRLSESLAGVVLSLGADYYRVESNIANYEFDDVKVSFALSRQWSL